MAPRWKGRASPVEKPDRIILNALKLNHVLHVFDMIWKGAPAWLTASLAGGLSGLLPIPRPYLFLALTLFAMVLVVCLVIGAFLRHYLAPHTEALQSLAAALPLLVEIRKGNLSHPSFSIERRKENPKKKDTADAKQGSLWPIEQPEKK